MSIPELYKEKLLLNELSPSEVFALHAKGFSQKDQKEYEKKTTEANNQFLNKHPANTFFIHLPTQNKQKRAWHFTPFLETLPVLGAAAVVLAGVLFLNPDTARYTTAVTDEGAAIISGERIKGADPLLFVYKKSAEYGAVLLSNKEVVRATDVLQVSYVSGGYRFGTIISVDGSGIVTQHYPDEKTMSGKLESTGETLLGYSYELDEAPYFERFIFLSANSEISLGALNKAFAEAKNSSELLELDPSTYVPKDCRVVEIVLLKEQ